LTGIVTMLSDVGLPALPALLALLALSEPTLRRLTGFQCSAKALLQRHPSYCQLL